LERPAITFLPAMPNSRSRRNNVSKQERQQRQAAARSAQAERRRQRGVFAYLAIGVAAILFVFGVLGQNLRGKDDGKARGTATTVAGAIACPREDGKSKRQVIFEHAPGPCVDKTKTYDAVFETTAGRMTFQLFPSRAYNAVNNFVFLARYHFYDGLPFHKVAKDTFVQTGDPVQPGITGPGYEFADDGLPDSSSAYVTGALVYAHESANTNGSQILLITGDLGQTLKPVFPLFGRLKQGFNVLAKINAGASNDINTPLIRYAIQSIDIREHKA
jgi:peptidylprolyl isomerase/peptidyl-prolyl cis-trans isomerase B (cyclophilin B)